MQGYPGFGFNFTGKERDAETGLDYFGARYYGNALGRFMTPDWSANPVPVPYAALKDPQTLNLYSYVRNNPVTQIDKDGHDLKVNGDDQERYITDLQKASGLTLSADKNGKISITKSPDKLSSVGKQIQKIIQDPKHHVNISARSNAPGVVGGSFQGNGKQTLSFSSIDKLAVPGGFSETSIVVHETTEAYAGTLNGSNLDASHQVGLDFENQQRLQEGLPARIGESATPLLQGARVEVNFSFFKESFDWDRLSGNISNVSVQHTNGPDGQLPKE